MNLSEDKFIVQMNEMKQQLYRIAFLYLKNESSALEAVDETIYLAYKNLKKVREPQFLKTWVTRILINECKKELRHKKKEELLEIFPEQGQEDYDGLPLKEAIAKLPEDLQLIINLRYFNAYTLAETSSILKLPQGTVATRQRKALSLLRLELEEE